jgi:hypothetical protein
MISRRLALSAIVVALAAPAAGSADPEIEQLLGRVGDRVRDYFQRAQSIVATETANLLPIGVEFGVNPSTRPRRLVYELRLTWDAVAAGQDPDPTVNRKLLTVDGRTPRSKDQPGCMDPQPVSPEPLSLLLREHRSEYIFTLAGIGKTDGHPARIVNYKPAVRGKPDIKWHDDCVSVSLPGRFGGRVWIDPETDDVLRHDEHLIGIFDVTVPPKRPGAGAVMVVERADTSTKYKPVAFHDPDETLMLPASIENLTVWRGSAVPELHIFQTYSDYKRFLADSHLVDDPR